MAQSLAQIYLHLVFSTKDRFPFLIDPEVREEMHAYLVGACRNLGCPALKVGGIEDHVHLACRSGRQSAVADFVRELKRQSSKWVEGGGGDLARFRWQAGYGAFSVSPGHLPALLEYIEQQESHHRGETFQAEFRRLLVTYGVDFDERYVWD